MYYGDKRLLSFFILVCIVTVGLGGWSITGPTPAVHTSVFGCHTPQSRTQAIRIAAAWEAELVANLMVLGLTVYRAVRQTGTLAFTGSLWHVMLRDGERNVLRVVICLANLANMLMFYFGDMITSCDLPGLTSTISVVMITRLLLNLRAAASIDADGDLGTQTSQPGTLRFAHEWEASQLAVGLTLIIRIYAMYYGGKRLLSFFILVSIVTVGYGGWSVRGPTPAVHTTLFGCHTPQSRTQAIRIAAAWEAELVANTMVLGLTVYRAVKQTGTLAFTGSLWHVMLRDGEFPPLVQFTSGGVICLANLANILMFYFGDMITSCDLSGLTSTISVVMITRVLLNLRAAAASIDTDGDLSIQTSQPGILRFAHERETSVGWGQERST
ncbi:hypothetical protein B0H19DRAFT_1257494 [Mycena capillaripes]|nr:hypothetical protein B0H19DRAFT_1257494 [Mycena capillaripes]